MNVVSMTKKKNLSKAIKLFIAKTWLRFQAWRKQLHVSPITRWWSTRKLLEAANRTALYPMAKKQSGAYVLFYPSRGAETIKVKPIDIGGDLSYLQTYPGYGHVFPWPSEYVRSLVDEKCKHLEYGLDGVIVMQIADHTMAADRVFYKRCLTRECIERAVKKFNPWDGFLREGGFYYILVTSRKRIEYGNLGDDPGWQDEGGYLYPYVQTGRKPYPGEYGRLKLSDGLYVVVLCTLDDRQMTSILFGPDSFTVTPLEKNLHAIFRRTPVNEMEDRLPGIDVGYQFTFGAVGDPTRCVVLEAERPVEKK